MEIFDLYDKDRNKLNKTMIRGDKEPDGCFRIVVHMAIFNNEGKMLIQHRVPFKDNWANYWDISCGGSAITGETSNDAAKRECSEELGINNLSIIRPAFTINFGETSGGFDNHYVVKIANLDLSSLTLQKEEVDDVKWASEDEILTLIKENKFIPYSEGTIKLLFEFNNKNSTKKAD